MTKSTLLVLDLNGLLVERIHSSKYNYEQHSHHHHGYRFKTPNGYVVFVRPYTKHFLRYVFDHFHVGVWSCMNSRNTKVIVNKLFTEEQQNALEFMMTQDDCYNAGEFKRDGSPVLYKSLIKIWKMPRYHKFYNHTLLIDNSENKAKYNPDFTAIHPTPFNHNYKNDKELKKLHMYLLNVDAYETVPFYVNIQPYNNETKVKKVRFSEIYDDANDNTLVMFSKNKKICDKNAVPLEEHDNQHHIEESAFKYTCRVLMKTIVFIGGVTLLAKIFSKLMMSINQDI